MDRRERLPGRGLVVRAAVPSGLPGRSEPSQPVLNGRRRLRMLYGRMTKHTRVIVTLHRRLGRSVLLGGAPLLAVGATDEGSRR